MHIKIDESFLLSGTVVLELGVVQQSEVAGDPREPLLSPPTQHEPPTCTP